MDKKFELITEKLKAADAVRKDRQTWKNSEINEKIKEKLKELQAAEKILTLESEAKVAWKFRESRKLINQHKKDLENKIQVEMLKLKIKQDLLKQQQKIQRVSRPKNPRMHPLPYLKNRNKSFIDSDVDSEDEIVLGILDKKAGKYQIGYSYGHTPGLGNKYWIQSGSRHISPDVLRIKY